MQTESSARIARLETLLDEKQAENDELARDYEQQIADLRAENNELRRAVWHVVENSMDMLRVIERGCENEKQRLEQILGRPVTKDTKLIEEMIKDRDAERAASS